MNPRLSGALRVLAALDGEPVPRKPVEPRRVVEKLCRDCQRQIAIVPVSSINWAVLERREPDGQVVVVNGVARERGGAYDDCPHWEFHQCNSGGLP